ncbi:ABC transporter substrate-binding protein [bacterium]|jgi:branched-chain amino acid transport system substrate-binding protein|nr:ABC transporter substrate-binding protein [bacterium]
MKNILKICSNTSIFSSKKIIRASLFTIFTFCLFQTLIYATDSTEKANIKLGMSAAFTGPSKDLGLNLHLGASAYFNYINDKGGINGQEIQLIAYDDGYNPEPAIRNTIKLLEKDNVDLLFGYVGTPTTTRILPLLKIYDKNDILLLFPFTGAEPQRNYPYDKYVLNLRASYAQETSGLVKHFLDINRKKIGVFYQIDAYGRSGLEGVKKELSKHNLKITSEATYRRGQNISNNYEEQVKKLLDDKVDVIISIGSYSACAGFIRDLRNTNSNIPVANVSFVGTSSLLNQLSELKPTSNISYTSNLINSQVVPHYINSSLHAVKKFEKLYNKHASYPESYTGDKSKKPAINYVAFEGFLDAALTCQLIKKAKHATREGIMSILEKNIAINIGIDQRIQFIDPKTNTINNDASSNVYYTTLKTTVNSKGTPITKIVPLTSWGKWQK